MRKNQRYSKEEMYLAIDLWQESGLTQSKFCTQEKLSVKTFSYWLRKYRKENGHIIKRKKSSPEAFIPVKVPGSGSGNHATLNSGRIDIAFPNGVQLSCPVGVDMHQLKTLINF